MNAREAQQGFTIIELMIVVAIIGILATIAIPLFDSFIGRSQAYESASMLDGARTIIEEKTYQSGMFPLNQSELISLGVMITGKYGTISGVADVASDGGKVVYQFNPAGAGVNARIAGKRVWLMRATITGLWSCETNLENNYAPRGCASGAATAPSGS